MDYDAIVIGAGAAGEAAATEGGQFGARVAVVERELVGGECAFWACLPSKTLLDAAGRRAVGSDYPWTWASARRDWMISREGTPYPDDGSHVKGLESVGVEVVRASAAVTGPGRVEVRANGGPPRTLRARSLIVATGAEPVVPPIPGLEEAGYWTSRDGTSLRELPSSIAVLGGGPVGVEMAQVYARFGVRTTIVEGNDRLLHRDHPRTSEILERQLAAEGVAVRLGVRARAARRGGAGRIVDLSDGSSIDAAQVLVAVGRRPRSLRELGLEEAGVRLDERGLAAPEPTMRVADGVYVAGDVAGGMQFTHLADYEGRVAIRSALGHRAAVDLSSVPRTTFTDPETSAVGLTVDEARGRGIDAFETTYDFAATARGYSIEPRRGHRDGPMLEGSPGHITAVWDHERRVLVGAFAASPAASEIIHEAVLALKQEIPIEVLADVIHAFPTGGRVFGGVAALAARRLGVAGPPVG